MSTTPQIQKPRIRRRTPTTMGIVKSDYSALLAGIIPILCWGLYVVSLVLGSMGIELVRHRHGTEQVLTGGDSGPMLMIAALTTVVLLPLCFLRVKDVTKLFATGTLAAGRITDISFHKDRGSIAFSYDVGNSTKTASAAVHQSAAVKRLRVGQMVDVVVAPA